MNIFGKKRSTEHIEWPIDPVQQIDALFISSKALMEL